MKDIECKADFVALKAGNWKTSRILYKWFSQGFVELTSALASEIMGVFCRLDAMIRCSIIIEGLSAGFFRDLGPHGMTDAHIIAAAASRFFGHVLPKVRERWVDRLTRLPWTTEELKQRMKIRYRLDERRAIELLSTLGSTASTISIILRLTRGVIKTALKKLQTRRRRQVILAGILCATRFKSFASRGELLSIKCASKCGGSDSFEHSLNCYKIHPPYEKEDPEKWTRFFRDMARRTAKNCPYVPIPLEFPRGEEGKISLDESGPSNSKCDTHESEEELSFDGLSSPIPDEGHN